MVASMTSKDVRDNRFGNLFLIVKCQLIIVENICRKESPDTWNNCHNQNSIFCKNLDKRSLLCCFSELMLLKGSRAIKSGHLRKHLAINHAWAYCMPIERLCEYRFLIVYKNQRHIRVCLFFSVCNVKQRILPFIYN